jgi:hypothetical protein
MSLGRKQIELLTGKLAVKVLVQRSYQEESSGKPEQSRFAVSQG